MKESLKSFLFDLRSNRLSRNSPFLTFFDSRSDVLESSQLSHSFINSFTTSNSNYCVVFIWVIAAVCKFRTIMSDGREQQCALVLLSFALREDLLHPDFARFESSSEYVDHFLHRHRDRLSPIFGRLSRLSPPLVEANAVANLKKNMPRVLVSIRTAAQHQKQHLLPHDWRQSFNKQNFHFVFITSEMTFLDALEVFFMLTSRDFQCVSKTTLGRLNNQLQRLQRTPSSSHRYQNMAALQHQLGELVSKPITPTLNCDRQTKCSRFKLHTRSFSNLMI